MDYTLFPDSPAFHSIYRLANLENGKIYSDKFILHVVDLNQIKLADKKNKKSGLTQWAELFKAKTWEEVYSMITKTNNEGLANAAGAMLYFNEDFWAQKEADDRAYYQFNERYKNELIEKLSEENTDIKAENTSIKAENSSIKAENASLITTLADKEAEITRLKALLDAAKPAT